MRKSNYDKYPSIESTGALYRGWSEVCQKIKSHSSKENKVIVVETYHGVYLDSVKSELAAIGASLVIDTKDLMLSEECIRERTQYYMTDDILFGVRAPFAFTDFLDKAKVEEAQAQIAATTGTILLFGYAAALVAPKADTLVYIDMARWEIQQRFRRKEINSIGITNNQEAPTLHYKRGYFLDWNVCDKLKKELITKVDFWIDTHQKQPKMIDGTTMLAGLERAAHQPMRVVPFFDPAPWGGQWMKEVCDLDPSKSNYGWCFDCVPEENSLYLKVEGELFEMASNNLVFNQTRALLGAEVESRFGQDFPIRFDFLDTIGGGHLSLQVHPTTQYIRDTFGIHYTQDESYYLLDVEEGAVVYLGLKDGVNPSEMIDALNHSQATGEEFDAEKFVNKWDASKHDHYLIPNGTIHCSGAGAMVLEISSTPSIFTFKLWDWNRVGLDGKPRPINIAHGEKVIDWSRTTELVKEKFINRREPIASGDGWNEERTGLHENEFIETRRHWFTTTVNHNTGGGVNVLNLVEGDEAIVESPTGAFEPYVVHYAETFIIPASVGDYTIRPYGLSEGKECATLKAYVRFKE